MTAQRKIYYSKVKRSGFTLTELMIVITIIAILSAIGFSSYTNAQKIGRDSRRKSDLKAIQTALELYYQQNGTYVTLSSPAYSTDSTWGSAPVFLGGSSYTNYINQMPKDPLDPSTNNRYDYFSSTSSTYYLCATLESPNTSDSNYYSGTDCLNFGSNTAGNYQLKNP